MSNFALRGWSLARSVGSAIWSFTKEVAPKVAAAVGPVILEALLGKLNPKPAGA